MNEWNNLKVHFAGLEAGHHFRIALKVADCRYSLYSCYRYIKNKKSDSDFTIPANDVVVLGQTQFRHIIQDSGLFTLMFGVAKDTKLALPMLEEWQERLVQFVTQNHLRATCVEVDCQKVLGPKEAWYLRKKLRDQLPNNEIINVFHFEDGRKGHDGLIEFASYIAISVPELRIMHPKTYKHDVCMLADYIKNKKPEIKIHLLGCTERELLKKNSFCTTSDSTAWNRGVKFGNFDDDLHSLNHVKNFKKNLVQKTLVAIRDEYQKFGLQATEKGYRYGTNLSICATIYKERYIKYCGPQD